MAGSDITIPGPDGSFSGYLARPDAPNGAGIVVIQEIFGVNDVMRGIADGLAAQGYLVLCPDLFWRIEPGVQLSDASEAEWKKAFALYQAFNVDNGIKDIAATIAFLRAEHDATKVGAVGFCLGGLLAYLTATRTDADASVSYYGVGIDQKLDEAGKITKPLMLHIAVEDGFVSKDAQATIRAGLAGNASVTVHDYPGADHGFARTAGNHYDAAAAALAGQRTADFFKASLT